MREIGGRRWNLTWSFAAGPSSRRPTSVAATLASKAGASSLWRNICPAPPPRSTLRAAWSSMFATTPVGGGDADRIHNSVDALASTANFLQAHGWQRGAGWDEGEPNFAALLEWNSAAIYAKTVALFADRLAGDSVEQKPFKPDFSHSRPRPSLVLACACCRLPTSARQPKSLCPGSACHVLPRLTE